MSNADHPRYGKCEITTDIEPILFRVRSQDGLIRHYKVYESDGPSRYGWYPQRGSMNSFLKKYHFDYAAPGFISDITGFEDERGPKDGLWFNCKNIWWFYLHIGFDHKTKKFDMEAMGWKEG